MKKKFFVVKLYGGHETWENLTDQEAADLDEVLMKAQEKCTKLFVLNVRRNAKFHSNLQKASQFIAKTVMRK